MWSNHVAEYENYESNYYHEKCVYISVYIKVGATICLLVVVPFLRPVVQSYSEIKKNYILEIRKECAFSNCCSCI